MYEFVNRADIEVNYVLHRKNVARTYQNDFRMTNSLVYYLVGGHTFFFGEKSVSAKAGDIALLPYGASYKNEILSSDTEYYQIDFCIYKENIPGKIVDEPTVISNLPTNNALFLFKEVFKNYSEAKPGSNLLYIADTLKILAMVKAGPLTVNNDKSEDIILYIRENCFEDVKIEEIAKHFNVSVSQLEKKVRAHSGMSPVELKNSARIEKAKQLLAEGLTIKQAAYETGFSDRYYFTKTFIRFVGQTPTQFIKSLAI
ncbi:MAG: helix-turn-helix transcriptional regulator [Clostridia bacterium]|nr:helix-turn-helix transcriptional regulator [Clostridia bacterium]